MSERTIRGKTVIAGIGETTYFKHGLCLQLEAVRKLRGDSVNQIPDGKIAINIAGRMVTPVSSVIMRTEDTL